MSDYRPYVNTTEFRYPEDSIAPGGKTAQLAFSFRTGDSRSEAANFDYLDLDELVAGHSQVSAVGLSVSRFYSKMLVSQPFEVTKFLLQTGEFSSHGADSSASSNIYQSSYSDYDFEGTESSSDEEVDYFVDVRNVAQRSDANAYETVRRKPKVKPSKVRSVQLFNAKTADQMFPQAIDTSGGPFVFSTLGAISEREGLFGLWHALNASCLYSAATNVVRAWSTSFLASLLSVPDPQFVDFVAAVDPWKLILISTAGCALTAAVLTPLAIIRARLIATSMASPDRPRSLRWSLVELVRGGQLLAPFEAVLPTTLSQSLYHFILTSAPVFMWKAGGISSFSSQKLYSLGQLGAKLLGLVFRLPLETLASRAQLKASHPSARSLIIKPAPYLGIVPEMWGVLCGRVSLASLYRGWRTEVVGLLGEWGYTALEDRPTQQERF